MDQSSKHIYIYNTDACESVTLRLQNLHFHWKNKMSDDYHDRVSFQDLPPFGNRMNKRWPTQSDVEKSIAVFICVDCT